MFGSKTKGKPKERLRKQFVATFYPTGSEVVLPGLSLYSVIFDGIAAGWFASSALNTLVYRFDTAWGWAIWDAVFALLFVGLLVWSVKLLRQQEALHLDIALSEGTLAAYDHLDQLAAEATTGTTEPEIVGYDPSNLEPVYREKATQDA